MTRTCVRTLALLCAAALTAASGGGCTEAPLTRPAAEVAVEAGPPQKADVEVVLRYPIEVSAAEKVNVSPVAVSGYLTKVHVDVGERVKAGQMIAEIDCREYVAQRHQAEQAIARWRAQVEQARAQLERLKAMDDRKLVAPAELDQARTARDVAEAQLANARAKVSEANQRQGYCILKAPFDGFVAERLLDPGAMVRPGGRPVVTIVKTQKVRVVVPVLEQDIPKIKPDAEVEVVLHALPQKPFRGRVARIGRSLDPVTRTLPVELDLHNVGDQIVPGMTGRAAIIIGKRPAALLVPTTAVLNLEEASYVFVVKDGRARRVKVELGVDRGDWLEVRTGLKSDDAVVIVGRELVTDGTPVAVSPAIQRPRAVPPLPKSVPEPDPGRNPDAGAGTAEQP